MSTNQESRNAPTVIDVGLTPSSLSLSACLSLPGLPLALAVQVEPLAASVPVLGRPASVGALRYASFRHGWCPPVVSGAEEVVRMQGEHAPRQHPRTAASSTPTPVSLRWSGRDGWSGTTRSSTGARSGPAAS